jgi:hypothetical protein
LRCARCSCTSFHAELLDYAAGFAAGALRVDDFLAWAEWGMLSLMLDLGCCESSAPVARGHPGQFFDGLAKPSGNRIAAM